MKLLHQVHVLCISRSNLTSAIRLLLWVLMQGANQYNMNRSFFLNKVEYTNMYMYVYSKNIYTYIHVYIYVYFVINTILSCNLCCTMNNIYSFTKQRKSGGIGLHTTSRVFFASC